jgi:hypothetical protein
LIILDPNDGTVITEDGRMACSRDPTGGIIISCAEMINLRGGLSMTGTQVFPTEAWRKSGPSKVICS